MYYITTDATCDLPAEFKADNHMIIPMVYLIDGVEYGIERNLTLEEFYAKIVAGAMPTTSLITTYFAKECLYPILKAGNDLIHLCFSSGLSATFTNLVTAIDELRAEFPERKIYLIDTRCASLGEGLINEIAITNRDGGMSIEDNYQDLCDKANKICHYFTPDNLFHLERGGRVSKAQAIFGTMLDIKPILHCNIDGKLEPIAKVRSRKKAIIALVDKFIEHYDTNSDNTIFIAHSDCAEDADFLKNKLIEKANAPADLIKIHMLGPVIGSHTGKGTVVLMFLGTTRLEKAE